MTYDEAIAQLEQIVAKLEGDEAIAMEDYKKYAQEASQRIDFCRRQLTDIENELGQLIKDNGQKTN